MKEIETKVLQRILSSMAEEYYEFNNKILKIINLKECNFKQLIYKLKPEAEYYAENNYLVIADQVYFNKDNLNLLENKIKFLKKVKNNEITINLSQNNKNKALTIELEKALDLLLKYKKNNHQQASFLQYKTNLLNYFNEQKRKILIKLGLEAAELGYKLYLVGGQIRDLLIGLSLNKDLDLILEGDLKTFFKHLNEKYDYEYDYNTKFSTGFLHNEFGYSIDIASCREEKYHFPGSLPLVEKADLFSDLFRRDFTINTLVIDLHPARKGTLYDFFGALSDLNSRILKVLHNYSFRDDPLRILRGIRFQTLKEFRLSAETVELSRKSLKHYDYNKLALERVFTELSYLLKTKKNISHFSAILLNQIPVLKLVKNDFNFDNSSAAQFLKGEKLLVIAREKEIKINRFLVRLINLFYNSSKDELLTWPLSVTERNIFLNKKWRTIDIDIFSRSDPAFIYRKLESYSPEELIIFAANNFKQNIVETIFEHLQQRKEIEIPINGYDLMKLGIPQGPEINKYLLKVRDQILRNKIDARKEALEYLKNII